MKQQYRTVETGQPLTDDELNETWGNHGWSLCTYGIQPVTINDLREPFRSIEMERDITKRMTSYGEVHRYTFMRPFCVTAEAVAADVAARAEKVKGTNDSTSRG